MYEAHHFVSKKYIDVVTANLTSKTYVDQETSKQHIAIADKANKNDIFHHDGSTNMSGNLNMGGNEIINLKPFVEDDDKDQTGHVIDFIYFHTRGDLKRMINQPSAEGLPKDGSESESMEGYTDMNNHILSTCTLIPKMLNQLPMSVI